MNKSSRRPARSRISRRTADALPSEASRLLHALDRPGAAAIPDPLEEERVIVRCAAGAVSLGGGRYARAALAELIRRDLAADVPGGPAGHAISEAGRAHLRRSASPGEDRFLAQHRSLDLVESGGESGRRMLAVNSAESPLAWLRRRRDRDGEPQIDAACFEAGERLRRDITQACMLPGVTSRWDPSAASGGAGPRDPAAVTDVVIAARQRARRAFAALGPDFTDLLIDLCGFLKGLETLERDRGWPARSGKVVVRLALGRLADHYGLRPSLQGPSASGGIRSWHAVMEEAEDTIPA